MSRAPRPRGLAACALLLVAACASEPAPAGVRAAPAGDLTPAFQRMRGPIVQAASLREQGDAGGLRALSPTITERALALLAAGMPHDLRRADAPRYLEGRAAFGGALKEWVVAVEAPDDEALLRACDRLVESWWGWVDAYHGLPPERAV